MVSNCNKNPIVTKSKKINMSTMRSATIVPKALSKGTFSYFFKSIALDTSPERGMVKFTKYETQTVSKSL